jgi:hypothetical protein
MGTAKRKSRLAKTFITKATEWVKGFGGCDR